MQTLNSSAALITHQPRSMSGSQQDLMPGQYSIPVQLFSMAAFALAFLGWLNETWLFWFDNPIWLNRYTEYGIILGFGIWRIIAEQNPYTRKRLIILVFMVTVFWWLLPWLYPFYEPYIGFLWVQPVFPALHVPGTITFFLILAVVFLFGRRIICGFNCPCVGVRETVGFPFRNKTLRSNWTWRLRHTKWVFFSYYVGIMVVTQFPPNTWTVSFVGIFYLLISLSYFGSFFISPLVGNRFYCRYLCPYGATFGLLNHAGFYGITMDRKKCNGCRRCEQVCDMGIPVWQQGQKSGQVTALEDCMGCARCVVSCPVDALEIHDVRNVFKKAMVQNASYLLKLKAVTGIGQKYVDKREDLAIRAPDERIYDWLEITVPGKLQTMQEQAGRCLDCGHPGCINACPLHNKIPQWMEQVAKGNMKKAAELAHSTSNFPEICGSLCPQHRLCEGACTRGREPDGAVTIGAIERFLSYQYLKDSVTSPYQQQAIVSLTRPTKRFAIIGAGPAGLTCADELNKAGYKVTIYDRNPVIGGLLATGVPSFKLDRQILTDRHQLLEHNGINFKLGYNVSSSNIRQILDAYDAIFVAYGAQFPCYPEIPGEKLKGVISAIDYLAQSNIPRQFQYLVGGHNSPNYSSVEDKSVVVLGAGDSAMDCARTAIRQKAGKVTVIYRGKKEAMRASPKELQAAREEGVRFLFELSANAIQGEEAVTSVQCKKQLHEQRVVLCDRVIFALGQIPRLPEWAQSLNIETHENGTIKVNRQGRTSNPRIYAGGDNTNGPDLIVTAIAAGRRAAQGMFLDIRLSNQIRKKTRTLINNLVTKKGEEVA